MKPTTLVLGFVAGVAAATGVFWLTSRPVPAPAPVVATTQPAEQPPAPKEIVAEPAPKPKPEPPKPAPVKNPPTIPVATVPEAPPEIPEPSPPPIPLLTAAEISAPPPVVLPTPTSSPSAVPAPPQGPNTVTLPAGTLIVVRLAEKLASNRSRPDDTFLATLDQPIVANGFVIAEKGSRVEGRVVDAVEAGRLKGTARLVIELTRISTSDGQKIAIRTATFLREAEQTRGDDIKRIGIGAVIGAAIGAAANGGKGAAIGAAAGGAAGAGTVVFTRGQAAILETETRLTFQIDEPVTITERL